MYISFMPWGALNESAACSEASTGDVIAAVGFDALTAEAVELDCASSLLHVPRSISTSTSWTPSLPLTPQLSPVLGRTVTPHALRSEPSSCHWCCVSVRHFLLWLLFPPLWNWVRLYLMGGCEVHLGWWVWTGTNGMELTRIGELAPPLFLHSPKPLPLTT